MLFLFDTNLTRGKQAVVSLDSTKVTGVEGISFQICAIFVSKSL